jgi:photosystem II stability/assembly factor-like uncharacterized protein
VGGGGGVWRTTNGGGHWVQKVNGLADLILTAVLAHPTNAQVAYTASSMSGVYKTKDEGATWSSKNTGLTDHAVFSLAMDPTDTDHLLAGTLSGVFESTDGASNGAVFVSGHGAETARILARLRVWPSSVSV